jgi:hypothetical protein
VGVWNRALIQLDKVMPGVLDHFAARSTWDGQQTDKPADPERPGNLYEPLDDDIDHGASGAFGDQDDGMLEPSFLRSLPSTAADLGGAMVDRCREIAGDWLARR